jgi:hypothetical protein
MLIEDPVESLEPVPVAELVGVGAMLGDKLASETCRTVGLRRLRHMKCSFAKRFKCRAHGEVKNLTHCR